MARLTKILFPLLATTLLVGAAGCAPDDLPLAVGQWPVNGEGAPGIDTSIDDQVLSYLGADYLPGATLAVTRGERLVWSKGYGWANRDEKIPMQPWHRSRIGSVSKIITTIGMLQLLENDQPTLGDLAIGGGSLEARLSQKVYGDPGADFTDPGWPSVNESTWLADPEQYWEAIREGVQDLYASTYETDMARMIEWASKVELGHLLTHTSGLVRSGDRDKAAAFYGMDVSDLTYPDIHKWVLRALIESNENSSNLKCYLDGSLYVDEDDPDYTGQSYQLPPFLFEPGTDDCYSNHGFGLVGHIIDEVSGPGDENTYRGVIERGVLEPLGLADVVPNNTSISDLDAWPHGSSLDPSKPSTLGLQTGGWSASAQDMTRVMCGLDRASNNLRLLMPQTVTTMETVAYPEASTTQPLGWDWRLGERLYKNGKIGGGTSVVMKFLPGEFDTALNDEINIAINVNKSAPLPGSGMLRSIAEKVAAADIPDDFDLFDPSYPCVVEEPLGFAQPTGRPSTPSPTRDATDAATPAGSAPSQTKPATRIASATQTAPPTRIAPPTVVIREPAPGTYPAPRGVASIDFAGAATDSAGRSIPGTLLRWTAIQGTSERVLCAGSEFASETSSTSGTGTFTARTDCTSFTGTLTTGVLGGGTAIIILLEARDPADVIGRASVTIDLFTPVAG